MTICIYDNGTMVTFDHFNSACAFMEEMEDYGYLFEFSRQSGDCAVYIAR